MKATGIVRKIDELGRVVLPVGEMSVSIVLSFIGAPFFLFLLRKKNVT